MGAFEASARQSGPKGLLPADDFTTLSRNYQALQPNLFPALRPVVGTLIRYTYYRSSEI